MPSSSVSKNSLSEPAKDRLKIGSSTESSSEERRYTEDLVAQEKALEQTRVRVAELEKNIADLQRLLDQAKAKSSDPVKNDGYFGLGGFGPAILTLVLMGLTGLLLWLLAKNARRSEALNFSNNIPKDNPAPKEPRPAFNTMPDRAKALFAGIDLDLTPVKKSTPNLTSSPVAEINPLTDVLRVKLNLARAYITIEDFAAAKNSLQEIVQIGGSIDPVITLEAQDLLTELSQRNN